MITLEVMKPEEMEPEEMETEVMKPEVMETEVMKPEATKLEETKQEAIKLTVQVEKTRYQMMLVQAREGNDPGTMIVKIGHMVVN